jgi:DNA-binding NarL/FixJ family response regulator
VYANHDFDGALASSKVYACFIKSKQQDGILCLRSTLMARGVSLLPNEGGTEEGRAPRVLFSPKCRGPRKAGSKAAAITILKDPMELRIEALLLHSHEESTERFRWILRQHFSVLEARSCAEASLFLAQPEPPHLVLTSPKLPDGTWSDVLSLARAASESVNVVVASPLADIRLYMETVEAGVYDFITASFSAPDISYIVKNAAESAVSRRNRQGSHAQSALRGHGSLALTDTPTPPSTCGASR